MVKSFLKSGQSGQGRRSLVSFLHYICVLSMRCHHDLKKKTLFLEKNRAD